MKKVCLLVLAAALTVGSAFGYYEVRCAAHDMGCWNSGEVEFIGNHLFTKYDCSCGDSVWVRN